MYFLKWSDSERLDEARAEGKVTASAVGSVSVFEACREAAEVARRARRPVAFWFNDRVVVVNVGDDPDAIARLWWKETYGETPEEMEPNALLSAFFDRVAELNQTIAELAGIRGVVAVTITRELHDRFDLSDDDREFSVVTSTGTVRVETERDLSDVFTELDAAGLDQDHPVHAR